MTTLKLLPVALIAVATLAAPAMARENGFASRHVVEHAATTHGERYVDGRLCHRAPDVGAFASQPWSAPPCEPAAMD